MTTTTASVDAVRSLRALLEEAGRDRMLRSTNRHFADAIGAAASMAGRLDALVNAADPNLIVESSRQNINPRESLAEAIRVAEELDAKFRAPGSAAIGSSAAKLATGAYQHALRASMLMAAFAAEDEKPEGDTEDAPQTDDEIEPGPEVDLKSDQDGEPEPEIARNDYEIAESGHVCVLSRAGAILREEPTIAAAASTALAMIHASPEEEAAIVLVGSDGLRWALVPMEAPAQPQESDAAESEADEDPEPFSDQDGDAGDEEARRENGEG